MTKKALQYSHWVPAKGRLENFPFSYDIEPVKEEDVENVLNTEKIDVEINVFSGEDLKTVIKNEVLKTFPFYRYLDSTSPEYIGKSNDLTYLVKIVYHKSKKKTKSLSKTFAVRLINFFTTYDYILVKSIDQLKDIIKENIGKEVAFDTEATGINPDSDYITEVSLAFERNRGYCIPINHVKKFEQYNLHEEALRLIYDLLVNAPVVYMFNSRFDLRIMEYSSEQFDMSKVNVIDAQVTAWYADADYRNHKLKALEKRFEGFYRPDLEHTLKAFGISGYNTAKIDPRHMLFYAAQDAVSTFCLGKDTRKYFDEFKLSAQIDKRLLYPLLRMENHPIRIDVEHLKQCLDIITPKLEKITEEVRRQIGDVNLNSPKQKVALFKSFGLDTQAKTKSGAMSTGSDEVSAMVERMQKNGEDVPEWVLLLNEIAKLYKLKSSFFESLYEQAKLNDGRIRINYRNTSAATGRLSSGTDDNE